MRNAAHISLCIPGVPPISLPNRASSRNRIANSFSKACAEHFYILIITRWCRQKFRISRTTKFYHFSCYIQTEIKFLVACWLLKLIYRAQAFFPFYEGIKLSKQKIKFSRGMNRGRGKFELRAYKASQKLINGQRGIKSVRLELKITTGISESEWII